MISRFQNSQHLHRKGTSRSSGVLIASIDTNVIRRPLQELPNNITDNLAHLELEANSRGENFGFKSPVPSISEPITPIAPLQPRKMDQYGGGHQSYNGGGGDTRYSSGSYSDRGSQYGSATPNLHGPSATPKPPPPSPFPPLHNRPGNIPPSSEERETILENAREGVLNSNDPEMQLVWAQDVLAHVDIAIQNDQRSVEYQAPRSRTPPVEHQLRIEALNVVKFLADQHHPQAEFMRGKWLEFGKFGYPINLPEAYRAYSRAAQNGYPRAEYRMGTQFENSGDLVKAVNHYSLGVNAGDSASCYRLGMMTLLGQQGQRQDYARGIDLIKFSANCADEDAPQGAYVYGMLLARELPQVTVPDQFLQPDINAARMYIEKAAFLGFAKAQSKIGAAYELSQLNCHFDPVLSLHYSNLAARQGDPEAEMAISKWFLCGYEEVFRKNEDMAFNYAQRAASAGLATAEFALGYFYEVGISVPVNFKEAQNWYRKAAAQGNKDAAARVEGISRSKTLSRKDHDRIAVAKIQSTHGSQRQNTADRFTSQAPTPNEYLSMPDVNVAKTRYSNGNYGAYSPTSPGPGPGSFGSPNNSPALGYGHQPPQRPIPSASTGRVPSANDPYRVSSPMSQGSNYSQSPVPTPHPGNFGPNQRIPSNTQSQFNQRPGLPPSPAPNRPNDPYQGNKPLPPLGFVAPADPTGADRIRRAQRNDDPRPPADVYGPPKNSASRPSAAHSNQSYQQNPRPSDPRLGAGTPSSGSRPPRTDSAPQRPPSAAPPQSSSQAPPSANSAAAKPPAKRPGKGPATFEEMGVPQGKKEEDCVSLIIITNEYG